MIGVKLKEDFDVQEVAFFNLSNNGNYVLIKITQRLVQFLFGFCLV